MQPNGKNFPEHPEIGAGYAMLQLSMASTAALHHSDPSIRSLAQERLERWRAVVRNILDGSVTYGSRLPVQGMPAWVTIEVAKGGFATGRLMAGGELTAFERELAAARPEIRTTNVRLDLNTWFLTDDGLEHMLQQLSKGEYHIEWPEEAALPTVAYLLCHQRTDEARSLVETIAPFFDRIRFFPAPSKASPPASAEVHIFNAGQVRQRLSQLPVQKRLATQKQVIEAHLPLYDAAIGMFLETYADGWPCRRYPQGWLQAAHALCDRWDALQRRPTTGRAHDLFALLAICTREPTALTGRDVGRIRQIVDEFCGKHGHPDAEKHQHLRARQRRDVAEPLHRQWGSAVAARLTAYPANEGIADLTPLMSPLTATEADAFALPVGAALPNAIRRRLERCRSGTIAELVRMGIITSGDTVARVLPALTAEVRSTAFTDPVLGHLYAATYRAFRRRRSLLLLNLQSQVTLQDLPWIVAIDGDRNSQSEASKSARLALTEAATVTVRCFPHAVLPNKLLQEFRALAQTAQLELPFVDELAADIFMGEFAGKFVTAAKRAARTIAGTLYADYYAIDTDALMAWGDTPRKNRKWWRGGGSGEALSALATSRAGKTEGEWSVAGNGAIIEQAQILTTHNLALLFADLDLKSLLNAELGALALQCFEWICRRQQILIADSHARLTMIKNSAYAWRQMIFYLALLDATRRLAALQTIEAHFAIQSPGFQARFMPAMLGLRHASQGRRLPQQGRTTDGARVFVGWTTQRHWLLT